MPKNATRVAHSRAPRIAPRIVPYEAATAAAASEGGTGFDALSPDLFERIARLADTRGLARSSAVRRGGLFPEPAPMTAVRQRLRQDEALPPAAITAAWKTSDFLRYCHVLEFMDGVTANCAERRTPPTARPLDSETVSYTKWNARIVCEYLDELRPLTALDLSSYDFDHDLMNSALRHPLRYLRLSTAAYDCRPVDSLDVLADALPALQQLEYLAIGPQRQPGYAWFYRNMFDGTRCVRSLLLALPEMRALRSLHLDFSQIAAPISSELQSRLQSAVRKHSSKIDFHVQWPARSLL